MSFFGLVADQYQQMSDAIKHISQRQIIRIHKLNWNFDFDEWRMTRFWKLFEEEHQLKMWVM